jgi:hypothetical protein
MDGHPYRFSTGRCILSPAYTPSVMQASLDNAFSANIQRIPGVQCMILLVHGDHNTEVSLSNSQVLKERCNGWCHPELIVIRGGSHNNIWNMHARQVLKPLRERVLFIGTQFSILYTCMYSPAEAATRTCSSKIAKRTPGAAAAQTPYSTVH